MLVSPTIQYTIYLYWEHYAELMRTYGAVKFSQDIYMGPHRNAIRLFEYFIKSTNRNKQTEK